MLHSHLNGAGPVLLAMALLASATVRADATLASRARGNFMLHCASCHMVDGRGLAGVVPDLHGYLGLFAQHPEARSFPARVPGAAGAPISDAELAEVLNWVLVSMNADQLQPGYHPYTAAEVGQYRQGPLLDVDASRDRLLKIIGYRH